MKKIHYITVIFIVFLTITAMLTACEKESTLTVQPTSPSSSSDFQPENRMVTERLILQNYITASPSLVISPDGQRTAYLSSYLNDEYIVVDGVESKLNHSVKPNSLVFSPNSQRLVYVTYEGSKYFVVADGIESGPYRYGMLDRGPPNPQFSPDSQHLVYVADRNRVILDGVEEKHNYEINEIVSAPVFSPDSQRLAYAARTASTRSVSVKDDQVVVEGESAGIRLVVDGIEGKRYDWIEPDSILFSPDSQQIAFVIAKGNGKCVVVDGMEGEEYFAVKYLVFSPDSRHFAYWGQNVEFSMAGGAIDQKNFIVVDGVTHSTPYSLNAIRGFFFTADSQHIVFYTSFSIFIDGTETKLEEHPTSICHIPPALSPNGKRLANVTCRRDESTGKLIGCVVVDGKPGKEYDGGEGHFAIPYVVFSPDSQHVVYPVYENQGKRVFVVVDGVEGWIYDSISNLVFDSPNQLRYNAQKGDSLYLVEETIK